MDSRGAGKGVIAFRWLVPDGWLDRLVQHEGLRVARRRELESRAMPYVPVFASNSGPPHGLLVLRAVSA